MLTHGGINIFVGSEGFAHPLFPINPRPHNHNTNTVRRIKMEQATEKQIAFAKRLGIADPESYNKDSLRILIDGVLSKEEPKAETIKPQEKFNVTFYTSYAKDLMVAGQTVEEAIHNIEKIRDAFS